MYPFLRTPFSRRSWRELAYVGVSLPVALFGFFCVYATFAPILPPAVAVTLWLAGWMGQTYRRLAKRLLDVDIAPALPGPSPAGPGMIDWTVAQLRDGAGWQAAAFAALQLPYAIVMAGVGAVMWLGAVAGITDPLLRLSLLSGHVVPRRLPPAIGLVLLFSAPGAVHALVRLDVHLMARLLGRRGLRERVRDLEQTRAFAVDEAAATMRRIERDLHDGAQARLVALAMDLTMLRDRLGQEPPDVVAARHLVDVAHARAKATIGELRDLVRGIHPPVLDRGLAEAMQTLAAHCPIPVTVTVTLVRRPTPAIERIAYFCAGELLTNVARHSGARRATAEVTERDGVLELLVCDDGVGGADAGKNGGTGLAGLADRTRGHEVVAVADAAGLFAHVERERPDVAVVDIRMPPSYTDEGLRAALRLREEFPDLGVLLFSQYVELRYAAELLDGLSDRVGYLLKERVADIDDFVEALDQIAHGGTALDPEVVTQLLGASRRREGLNRLTPREREVLALMAEGRSNSAIAAALVVSERAVEKHVTTILAKLDLPPSDADHRRVLAVLRYLAP